MERREPLSLVTLGFRAAGCVNVIGMLIFSLGFTNAVLTSLSPVVFSGFGLLMIMLWGFAYLAVARSYQQVPYLVAVFAIEKFVYSITWVVWLSQPEHDLATLFPNAPLTAVFYAIYGPNDFLFGLFFAAVAANSFRAARA